MKLKKGVIIEVHTHFFIDLLEPTGQQYCWPVGIF
jgi:hypothetical protein